MKITTAIVHDPRGRAKKGEPGQIDVRITYMRKSIYIGTGVRVRKSEFVAGRVVGCAGADRMNERLAVIYDRAMSEVNACIASGAGLDVERIRRAVWAVAERVSDRAVFLEWVEDQIPLLNVSEGTRKHYWPLLVRLKEFGRITRWDDATVENIADFDSFLHQLRRKPANNDQPCPLLSDAAVWNYHKCLRALLHRAYSFGKIDLNPYDRLKGKFSKGERENLEYLTESEMRAFETLLVPTGSMMEVARDLFVFQMYTGLSFSDAQAFNIKQYKWNGAAWQHIGERIKTGVPFVSQLLPPAVRVLEKYDMKVPKMNNADYNHLLKALGAMAGIETRMHSHLARHTFATYMLRNGAKIESVSRMLGHTNITQTQRYAKVLAQSVHEDFDMIAAKLADNF